ncbi:hypothetical protein ACHAO9_011531 [Fusarium lateritium]
MLSGGEIISNGQTLNVHAETATFVDPMRSGYQVAMLQTDWHYPVSDSMRAVRRVTIVHSTKETHHQEYHGPAIERIVDSGANTAAVPRLALQHLASKAVQAARPGHPRRCPHQGIEGPGRIGLANKNIASSKMTTVAASQVDDLPLAGRVVRPAKLILRGIEGRELIGLRQGMMEGAKSQQKTKKQLYMLEVLCHQGYQQGLTKLMARINQDTALLMINNQVHTVVLLLPVVVQLFNQRYESGKIVMNQRNNNIKEDRHMGGRLHLDRHKHMYSDIHMISYSRGNALTKKGPKINRIPDDSSHTPNNLRSDRPLLMRSLLRMASKEHIQDILPMLFPTTALAGRKWSVQHHIRLKLTPRTFQQEWVT